MSYRSNPLESSDEETPGDLRRHTIPDVVIRQSRPLPTVQLYNTVAPSVITGTPTIGPAASINTTGVTQINATALAGPTGATTIPRITTTAPTTAVGVTGGPNVNAVALTTLAGTHNASTSMLSNCIPVSEQSDDEDMSVATTNSEDDVDELGVVAWLTPMEGTALTALTKTLAAMHNDPTKYELQFKMLQDFDLESCGMDHSEVGAAPAELRDRGSRTFAGHTPAKSYTFKLALCESMLKELFEDGWWLGVPGDITAAKEIDFLVAVKAEDTFLEARYAHFLIDRESYQIVLRANWQTFIVNSAREEGTAHLENMERRVLLNNDVIHIGACAYKFEYAHAYYQPGVLATCLRQYMQENQPDWLLNDSLLAVTPQDVRPAGSYFYSASSPRHGKYALTFSGWDKQGRAVTVERVRNLDRHGMSRYWDMLQRIRNDVSYHRMILMQRLITFTGPCGRFPAPLHGPGGDCLSCLYSDPVGRSVWLS